MPAPAQRNPATSCRARNGGHKEHMLCGSTPERSLEPSIPQKQKGEAAGRGGGGTQGLSVSWGQGHSLG